MNTAKKTIFYFVLTLLSIFLLIYYHSRVEGFIINLKNALKPFFLGLIIAYIINILMSFFEKLYFPHCSHQLWVRKTKRPVCLIASLLTLAGILSVVIYLVIPELIDCLKILITEIPYIIISLLENETASKLLPDELISALSDIDWQEAFNKASVILFDTLGSAAETLFSMAGRLISSVITAFLSTAFAIYILVSKETLSRQLKTLLRSYLPSGLNEKILRISSVFNESFRGFIVGQCIEAAILGLLCIAGMYLFRFPYPVMIGTLIGFTALIPIAGAFIGAIAGAIMILTVSPGKAFFFLIFILVLQQLEENLIYPRVVGNRVGLPAVFVLLAIAVGGGIFGILGILISVPVFSAFYKIIRNDISRRDINNTLSQ